MYQSFYDKLINIADEIKYNSEENVNLRLIESMTPRIKTIVENSFIQENVNENKKDLDEKEELLFDAEEENASENCNNHYVKEESIEEINLKKIKLKINELKEKINSYINLKIFNENNNSKEINKNLEIARKYLVFEITLLSNNKYIKKDNSIFKEYIQLIEEFKNMKKTNRGKYLNESLKDLLEMNIFEADADDDDLDDLLDDSKEAEDKEEAEEAEGEEVEEEAEEAEEETEFVLSADSTLEQMAKAAGILDDEEISEGFVFEGEEDEEVEEGEEGEGTKKEGWKKESRRMSESRFARNKNEIVYEISENILREGIRKMKNLRESRDRRNVASRRNVARTESSALREAAKKNMMLESKIDQYKDALQGMKSQLTEMNLFNAKLLYANKLMQNKDLTLKQQKHIVESLDEASTLSEAKLLFEGLTKSLARKSMNESSSRNINSNSSRTVKSAQPINENLALDRWATLAGIKN